VVETPLRRADAPRRAYAPRLAPELRREQLLDAALSIAVEQGFHAVTIDRVARAADVTRPVVYALFADRHRLLDALLDREEGRALDALAPALPPVPAAGADVDPDELLVAGVTAYLTAVRDRPKTWRVILVPPEGAPAALQERVVAHRRLLLARLRELVVWGLGRRGGPDIDVDLFARAVVTLAEGAARLVLADPDRWPVDRFVAFTRTLLGGLRG
jgi:AcrR family transcriptional regulator